MSVNLRRPTVSTKQCRPGCRATEPQRLEYSSRHVHTNRRKGCSANKWWHERWDLTSTTYMLGLHYHFTGSQAALCLPYHPSIYLYTCLLRAYTVLVSTVTHRCRNVSGTRGTWEPLCDLSFDSHAVPW